jgi:hypothetical protein
MCENNWRGYLDDAESGCCGGPLDRDFWNNQILDRNFLIRFPYQNHLVYPQSTGLCLQRDPNWVIECEELWKKNHVRDYWVQNNAQGCPPKGMPLLCDPVKQSEPCEQETNNQNISNPWSHGNNRNVDAESFLQRLNYLNNQDCYENKWCNKESVCDGKATNKNQFDRYFQDTNCIYPNYTPKFWDNLTKARSGVSLITVDGPRCPLTSATATATTT